ncbi:immunoglobulin E-set [Zopfochytrium polystomum]|nr:immunoglobulin E-set [Zopfochytrium polystomum]
MLSQPTRNLTSAVIFIVQSAVQFLCRHQDMFDDSFASGGDESERPAKRAMMSLGGDEFNHAVAENLLAALGGEEFDGGSLNAFDGMIASSTAAEKNATPHLQQRQMALEGHVSDFATSPLNAETPSLTNGLTTQVPPTTASPAPTTRTPTIHRIIPSSGPMTGGIEVTLLGSNLHQNLTVLFGGVPAASLHSWGSGSTLVCILPPSSTPGPMPVTFKERPLTSITAIGEVVIFTYRDETERALMELALQVVGLKMTGRLEDARDVAMRIVSDTAKLTGESAVVLLR